MDGNIITLVRDDRRQSDGIGASLRELAGLDCQEVASTAKADALLLATAVAEFADFDAVHTVNPQLDRRQDWKAE